MLAVVETHPIQYHAPVYRALERRCGIPVTAIYASDFSVAGYRDADFGATFAWDTDLLSGYTAKFLTTVSAGGAANAESASTRGLREALRATNPDAVLIGGYSPGFHRAAWFEAWRSGHPILFRGETNDAAGDRGWLKDHARRAALRVAYRSCARLLYIGRLSHAHYQRLRIPESRLVFSPYCVDPTPFATSDGSRIEWRGPTRRAFEIADTDLMVLFSGKLTARKGADLLVEAVRALPADVAARVVLGFLGDGEARASIAAAARIAPQVRTRFFGFQNQSQLSRFYHAADVLVLPSRASETWGLVVNEALHHGVPCIVSSRVGAAPDLVEPGVTGDCFESGSARALAEALVRTMALCGRADVRAACRARVAGFSIDAAADGIAAAFHAVARKPETRMRRAG